MEDKVCIIFQREVNPETGDIFVSECRRGTMHELMSDVNFCRLRSKMNIDLVYALCYEYYEKETKQSLENRVGDKESKFFVVL